jgi:hypothetical protein
MRRSREPEACAHSHRWRNRAALRSDGRQSYVPLQALIADKLIKARFPNED